MWRDVLGLVVLIAALGLLVIAPIVEGYLDTRNAPRADMFECEKHGLFDAKYIMLIDLQDGGKPVQQCPFCYEDAFKKADEELKKREAMRVGVPK